MMLIIDNDDSFTYNLYQMIAMVYPGTVRVVGHESITLTEIHALALSGLVLSPGPGHPKQAQICIDLIQSMVFENTCPGLPVLGVCLGHQAMVLALGGEVVQAVDPVHGQSDDVYHDGTGLYQSLPNPFKAGRYHSLVAEPSSLPSVFKIEASTRQGLIMGVRHWHLPLYGVQFHPESVLTPEGSILLKHFVACCRKPENQKNEDFCP